MAFRFEKLEVWQRARRFVSTIYRVTGTFPRSELFSLVAQLRRASLSIASNIAEGSDRKSDVEFARFLRMSLTSVEEVVTQLYIALDLNYINQAIFDQLYKEANELAAMINGLVNSLRHKQ